MIFARVGYVVAIVVSLLSLFRLVIAFLIASNDGMFRLDRIEATRRYLSGTKTTGQVIDQAVYVIFLMIVLGILCEIYFVIKTKSQANQNQSNQSQSKE